MDPQNSETSSIECNTSDMKSNKCMFIKVEINIETQIHYYIYPLLDSPAI